MTQRTNVTLPMIFDCIIMSQTFGIIGDVADLKDRYRRQVECRNIYYKSQLIRRHSMANIVREQFDAIR